MEGDYVAHVDRAKVTSTVRWNIGVLVGSIVLAVVFVGLFVFVLAAMPWWLTLVLTAIAALLSVLSAVLAFRRGRALRLLTGGDAVALAIDAHGVRLGGAPFVPWSEIVFIGVLDDRARTGRLMANPLSRAFGAISLRAGNGLVLCEIAVRDGAALQAAFADPAAAKTVAVFDPIDGAAGRGLVPLFLDVALDEAIAHQAAGVLLNEAARRGIPARHFDQIFPYFEWKSPMIDPKWQKKPKKGVAAG